jgi:hypothetical protein
MSMFKYFKECTFCQSRIGSTDCLLPFQFTQQYVAPTDEMSMIIDITEIHMQYGIAMLKNNFEMIHWIKNRPTADQISEYADSVRQGRLNDQQMLIHPTWNAEHSQLEYVDNSCQTDSSNDGVDLQSQIVESPSSVQKKDSSTQYEVAGQESPPASISEELPAAPVWPKLPSRKAKQPAVQLKQPDRPPTLQETESLNRDDQNHVVQDVVIAIKTAFNLHANQRGSVKTQQFLEALMNESNIMSVTGDRYVKSMSTSLDGSRALSKEITARHSHDDVQRWESGKKGTQTRFCILNSDEFQLPLIDNDPRRLEECLIRYFQHVQKFKFINEPQSLRIMEMIKFELERQQQPLVFGWIQNKVKTPFLTSQEFGKVLSTKSLGRASQSKPPYPPIDQKVIDHVNSHLQLVVNRQIVLRDDDIPKMLDETKVETFVFKLVSEFIRRNKGWLNETSFTSPQHLTRLEETTGLKSRVSDAFITFDIIKAVLTDFRATYRDKYPKRTDVP